MTNLTKAERTSFYQALNFLGTAEWAMDLEDSADSLTRASQTNWEDCSATTYPSLNAIVAGQSIIVNYCISMYIVDAPAGSLSVNLANYISIVNDGYDDKSNAYAGYVK
jgi:hypothetical protein